MQIVPTGTGVLPCQGHDLEGKACTHREIEGLGYCFAHMPDEFLEEAEQITGMLRCRERSGQPDSCRQFAVKGSLPPTCKNHGLAPGGRRNKDAATRVVKGRVMDRLAEVMAEHGEKLLRPSPIGDPLTELLELAAEIRTWKEICREVTAYLLSKERIRYSHNSYGEQIRAEILLYERALERLGTILLQISKLGIEHKLAAIQKQQVDMVDRALTAALTASGLDLVAQQKAREVLSRELVRVAS